MSYFQRVLARILETLFVEALGARAWVLERMADRIHPTNQATMDNYIEAVEILATLKAMPSRWTLGPDGIPSGFYITFSDLALPLLEVIYNKAAETRELLDDFLNGDIKLLPKSGDLTILNNKRSITLLDTKYKTFTKL